MNLRGPFNNMNLAERLALEVGSLIFRAASRLGEVLDRAGDVWPDEMPSRGREGSDNDG